MRAADMSNSAPDLDRGRHSLDGLSMGDAFGNRTTWYGDTTCPIVGGIVALSAGTIPADWLERREALPPR